MLPQHHATFIFTLSCFLNIHTSMHYMYSLLLQVPVMTSVSVGYKLCRVHTQVCRCLHNICLCACSCLYVLKMVSPDKILCCKNTLITIIIVFLFMCNVLCHLVFVLKFYCHCTMLWAPPPPLPPHPHHEVRVLHNSPLLSLLLHMNVALKDQGGFILQGQTVLPWWQASLESPQSCRAASGSSGSCPPCPGPGWSECSQQLL